MRLIFFGYKGLLKKNNRKKKEKTGTEAKTTSS